MFYELGDNGEFSDSVFLITSLRLSAGPDSSMNFRSLWHSAFLNQFLFFYVRQFSGYICFCICLFILLYSLFQVLNQLSLAHSTTPSSSTHNTQSLTNGHLPPSSSQPTPAQSAVQSAVQTAIRNAQSAKINNPSSVSSLSDGLPPSVSQLLPSKSHISMGGS